MNTNTTLSKGSWIQLNERRAARTVILLLLLLLLTLPAVVQAQFTYTTNTGTITITGYTGPGGAVTIPCTIARLPVTTIGDQAFYNCTSLTSVRIPDGVTSILADAFAGCGLTSIIIPNSVASIGVQAFSSCTSLTNLTIGSSVTNIGDGTFALCGLTGVAIPGSVIYSNPDTFAICTNLTSVTIGNGITSIGGEEFWYCTRLTSVTIPSSVTLIRGYAFDGCGLTRITIPDSVTNIALGAFGYCTNLTSVIIGNNVTTLGIGAFADCTSLTAVYFRGNAPSLDSDVFTDDNRTIVYYLPGTTGWGTTFGGRPTALWTPANPPTLLTSPRTQTAEAGSAVGLRVKASGSSPLFCLWYLNDTNLISCSTNCELELTNVQFPQSGAYAVVISNAFGTVTSPPALLNVVTAVERRPVPGVKVAGQTGSLLNVDYADSLSPASNWTPLGSVSLTGTPQYCFDLTLPFSPQRFYRTWQAGTPGVRPSLSLPGMVPAITLTGGIGHSVRLDCINQFGPTDAWATLATVPLTNTSQLYLDVTTFRQPTRLYRLVPSP